jgi:hypothetical protein
MGPEFEKVAYFRANIPPLFPVTHPHPSPEPVIYFRDWTIILRYPKIVHPALEILR